MAIVIFIRNNSAQNKVFYCCKMGIKEISKEKLKKKLKKKKEEIKREIKEENKKIKNISTQT